MPWQIQDRDGRYCVVKEGESEPVPGGCHDARVDAIKHQRALYANESRVASLYVDLDALEPDAAEKTPEGPAFALELVRELGRITAAATPAIHIDVPAPVVNFNEGAFSPPPTPNVVIEAAATPETPVEQPAPIVNVDVHVPESVVNVEAPAVSISLETPARTKDVEIERDVLSGQITGYRIEEV